MTRATESFNKIRHSTVIHFGFLIIALSCLILEGLCYIKLGKADGHFLRVVEFIVTGWFAMSRPKDEAPREA